MARRLSSTRPRDAAGRPLPWGTSGVEPVPEVARAPEEALRLAQHLLDAGRPFAAHEVLEGAWKSAPEPERELWRGLAQLAVGLTHRQRGNVRGAVALLSRAAERLEAYGDIAPHGIRAARLAGQARAWAKYDGPGAEREQVVLCESAAGSDEGSD